MENSALEDSDNQREKRQFGGFWGPEYGYGRPYYGGYGSHHHHG